MPLKNTKNIPQKIKNKNYYIITNTFIRYMSKNKLPFNLDNQDRVLASIPNLTQR